MNQNIVSQQVAQASDEIFQRQPPSKYFILERVSRAIHLFAVAYIVGQSFSIFTVGA
jgi:hypothetical protein